MALLELLKVIWFNAAVSNSMSPTGYVCVDVYFVCLFLCICFQLMWFHVHPFIWVHSFCMFIYVLCCTVQCVACSKSELGGMYRLQAANFKCIGFKKTGTHLFLTYQTLILRQIISSLWRLIPAALFSPPLCFPHFNNFIPFCGLRVFYFLL